MKKIAQLFPRVKASTVMNTLDKHHIAIEDPDKVFFSNVNLVTGPNGAGKTRFLNALRELYQKVSDVDILYGYFPGLSFAKPPKQDAGQLRVCTLQEFKIYADASFDDFFREIEAQSEEFVYQLLEFRSQREEGQNRETFRLVAGFFSDLTGKKLVKDPALSGLAVEDADGVQTPLRETLERLSPGERMLFYMSIFLSLKRNLRGRRVIILDEPESHLHPKALLQFVRTLCSVFPGTTIWMATHSLFLLPEFQFENIVYLENGVVLCRHSDLYQKALSGLLGEGNENVSRFFASLPHWQYFEFIAECFTNPVVISTVNPKDDQVRIFIDALQKHKITSVLDCGGGSGRLGESMMKTTVAEWSGVTYEIYDARPSYKGRAFKVYTRLEDAPGNYDCVVMMNFLHEVPPEEWSDWFRKIYDLMAPEGHLLFVEVDALQTGECPNDGGYLVLGMGELAELFAVPVDKLSEIRIGDKSSTFGVLVNREYLLNVEKKTVSAAIQRLEKRSYEQLRAIRAEENRRRAAERGRKKPDSEDKKETVFDARRYAFFSQQYINAKLFNDAEREREKAASGEPGGAGTENTLEKEGMIDTNRERKLRMLLDQIDVLLSKERALSPETCMKIGFDFRDTVDVFLRDGVVPEGRLDYCHTLVDMLERANGSNTLIMKLLLVERLMNYLPAFIKFLEKNDFQNIIQNIAKKKTQKETPSET